MKAREYCCCAIPLVNSGIYATLTEQLVSSLIIAILSFATPAIVGAATPSFAKWILGIICLVVAGVQLFGFLGVAQEKPVVFRRYITLHSFATLAAFAVAAAWVIISASKHSTAESNCLNDFYNTTDSTEKSEGNTLCNIFPWVDVGLMAGVWVWLAIMHVYLYVVINSYSSAQQRDHVKYNALNDPSNPLNGEGIPMDNRDAWNSGTYDHARQTSASSMTDVNNGYDESLSKPHYAYTQDPGPTPRFQQGYYDEEDTSGLHRPTNAQAHPAEGFGRRKTPRFVNPYSDM